MRALVEFFRSRPCSRAAAFALIAISAAGCSSEVTRFDENPFATRNRAQAANVPASAPAPVQAAPAGRIDTQPLPPTAMAPAAAPQTVAAAPQPSAYQPAPRPVAQASYQAPSYQPPSYQPSASYAAHADVTGSVQTPHRSGQGWRWDGGTAITVGPGETLDSIARKHSVPVEAILQANGLTRAARLRPGQRLVIPRYNGASVVAHDSRAAAHPGGATHVVVAGETLHSLSRHYGKPVSQIAAANHMTVQTRLKIGDHVVIPGVKEREAKPTTVAKAAAPAPARPAAPAVTHQPPAHQAPKVASAEPQPAVHVAAPTAEAQNDETNGSGPASSRTPSFRWPVRGRVITAFGSKGNGQQNDGIDLAVPEGTAVRAAEDGVVAYAGNELKGYGNLILVRHGGNFVTAYAHASEILVKRGDQIRRGQVIARSGQTGNVSTPQLHFEIRKGSAPVDPMQYLPGA
ncbi:MAG TPA: LysM peptidoglycan-binding domain-containing M23 family metallopeptidase [Xanthobacteraceae bacterium]|jgi:murein DD-endopeptidase MepM/ murein hydrolase activator NlpD|nr:LysM peptidoglycan-binding domain-containing M23 family metallopeptidase [Xanthobacteraceae bacterium]